MEEAKMKARRLIGMLLCLAVLASLLAGCAKTQSGAPAETGQTVQSTDTPNQAQETAEPEVERKLVVGIQSQVNITDYEDNYLTKLVAETLDCELEMVMLPADLSELTTKLALMATTPQELPDIILTDGLNYQVVNQYGANGIFVDVMPYLEDPSKTPNFNAIGEEYQQSMFEACAINGKMYTFPSLTANAWDCTPYRMYINQTWLDKLGLEIPTTTEEYKEVLRAFATQDPNGNGVADEIPIYGVTGNKVWGGNCIVNLMNAFIYYNPDTNNGLALDETGKKVIAPFTMDGFKEGLAYMHELYSEGLLPDAIFTDDSTQFKSVLNNEECNIVGSVVTGSYGNWSDADNNPNFNDMTLIDPLIGPEGVQYTAYNGVEIHRNMVITCNCKNIDLAVAFGDLFYSHEFSQTSRFGELGVDWVDWTEDAEFLKDYTSCEVEAGLAEAPTHYVINDIWTTDTNKFWHGYNPRFAPATNNQAKDNMLKETFAETGSKLKSNQARIHSMSVIYYMHPDHIIPVLSYDDEAFAQIGDISLNIYNYVNQAMAQFIVGERDIETGWDSYLQELDAMGLQQWLEVSQTTFEAAH